MTTALSPPLAGDSEILKFARRVCAAKLLEMAIPMTAESIAALTDCPLPIAATVLEALAADGQVVRRGPLYEWVRRVA